MKLDPYTRLSVQMQRRALAVLAWLAIVLMVTLQVIDTPLRTGAAPWGIVSFELAGEVALAREMVASWGEAGRSYAGWSLGLDYLFMVAYAGAISLCCAMVARRLKPHLLIAMGMVLAWGQWVAAGLDALENVALIRVLLGSERALWPLLARWCAIPKFAIIASGFLFIVGGIALAWAWGRKHRASS